MPARNLTPPSPRIGGGCLCGALRYVASEPPFCSGYCFCGDCRKASGSGYIPFMGFAADAVAFQGATLQYRSKSARGRDAVRNSCPTCAGLVFGGVVGIDATFSVYAGSLDDSSSFQPTIGIFIRSRAPWVVIPPGLTLFEELPD